MKTVCHSEGSALCYPDVTRGATIWAWSDEKPKDEIVRVSAHALRRLLRAASRAYPFVATTVHGGNPHGARLYEREITPEKAIALLNELSSIWCECNLVMSRLFVTPDNELIVHKDEEVDAASIPPWETSRSPAPNAADAE